MIGVSILHVRRDLHVPGLFFAKAQVVTAQTKLNGVSHWRAANHFDRGAVTEAHLQQPAAQIRITADGNDTSAASDAELVQAAGFGGTAMVTTRKSTCLLHTSLLPNRCLKYTSLRLSFNGYYAF